MVSVSSLPVLVRREGRSPMYLRMACAAVQASPAISSLFSSFFSSGCLSGSRLCRHNSSARLLFAEFSVILFTVRCECSPLTQEHNETRFYLGRGSEVVQCVLLQRVRGLQLLRAVELRGVQPPRVLPSLQAEQRQDVTRRLQIVLIVIKYFSHKYIMNMKYFCLQSRPGDPDVVC